MLVRTQVLCGLGIVFGLWIVGDWKTGQRENERARARITSADSFVTYAGKTEPVLARDSSTLIIALDTKCAACRLKVREYIAMSHEREQKRVAIRFLVVGDSQATRQFGRLAGDTNKIGTVQRTLYKSLRVTEVPSFFLIDSAGRIRRLQDPLYPSRPSQRMTLPQ